MHQIRRSGWTGASVRVRQQQLTRSTCAPPPYLHHPIHCTPCATPSCIVDYRMYMQSVQHLTFTPMHSLYLYRHLYTLCRERENREAAPLPQRACLSVQSGSALGHTCKCTCTHETAVRRSRVSGQSMQNAVGTCGRYG